MVRKSISNDSISSYNYMDKQVMSGSNEAVGLRYGDNGKFKDKICHGGASGGGSTDSEVLSSWPSRHYTCNFCKRRFKSAQALGGHMNVHRRARAMLISPISSPPSSPWLPNSITSANNPFQHDDHHLTNPNPTPNYPHWPLYTPHCTINPSPSNLSHLPMFNLTQSCSLVSTTHKNSILPAACICRHMLNADQYHHAELRTTDQRVMKNCIRAENQVNGSGSRTRVHQDDMVSGLSLGTTVIPSRPAAEEDVDLELRLGF